MFSLTAATSGRGLQVIRRCCRSIYTQQGWCHQITRQKLPHRCSTNIHCAQRPCSTTVAENSDSSSSSSTLPLKPVADLPHWVTGPATLDIYKATSVDELIALCKTHRFSTSDCVSFMAKLAKLHGPGFFNSFLDTSFDVKNVRFMLLSVLGKSPSSSSLKIGDAMHTLRSAVYLGMGGMDPVIQLLQSRLLRLDADYIALENLVSFLVLHQRLHTDTKLGQALHDRLQGTLTRRVASERCDAERLLHLMNELHLLTDLPNRRALQDSLERALIDCIDEMSVASVCRLFGSMARAGSRNLALLRCATDLLNKRANEEIPWKSLVALIQAAAKLKFNETAFFNRIEKELMRHMEDNSQLKVQTFTILLNAFGNWRYRHVDIFQKLCQWAQANIDQLGAAEKLSLIMCLARCHFVPDIGTDKNILAQLRDSLKKEDFQIKLDDQVLSDQEEEDDEIASTSCAPRRAPRVLSSQDWLNLVWSFGVLNCLTESLALSVLDDREMLQSLTVAIGDDTQKNIAVVNRMRILQLRSCCKFDLKMTEIPEVDTIVPNFPPDVPVIDYVARYRKRASDRVSTIINHIAVHKLQSKVQFVSPEGYFIDAEIVLGEDGKPLETNLWEDIRTLRHSENVKSVQKQIAVLCWEYLDHTQGNSKVLLGANAMCVRHLKALGYYVLQIENSELTEHKKFFDQVNHMKCLVEKVAERTDV